jgi:inhibitor of cysteine peptidase
VPSAEPPSRITVSDSGGQVTLAVRQELGLQLEANPTTGYGWEVVPAVPEVLTVVDPGTYHASSVSEPRVGSGGTTSFVFRALRQGTGVLNLAYRRSWETGVPPARMVRIDVNVRPE